MFINYLFTDRKPDPCSAVFILVVQSLKKNKDLVKKYGFDTNTIVANAEQKMVVFFFSFYLHPG